MQQYINFPCGFLFGLFPVVYVTGTIVLAQMLLGIFIISMPGIGGFESIRRLINRNPHCKILVFSIHNELVYVTRALKAGAKGYITKNSVPETLVTAVYKIAQGGTYVDPDIAQQLAFSMASEQDEADKIKLLSPKLIRV